MLYSPHQAVAHAINALYFSRNQLDQECLNTSLTESYLLPHALSDDGVLLNKHGLPVGVGKHVNKHYSVLHLPTDFCDSPKVPTEVINAYKSAITKMSTPVDIGEPGLLSCSVPVNCFYMNQISNIRSTGEYICRLIVLVNCFSEYYKSLEEGFNTIPCQALNEWEVDKECRYEKAERYTSKTTNHYK